MLIVGKVHTWLANIPAQNLNTLNRCYLFGVWTNGFHGGFEGGAEQAEGRTEKAWMLMFLCSTHRRFAPETLAALTIAYSNLP